MSDINKDKLLYVPETKPVRDYESKGQFQDTYIPYEEEQQITQTSSNITKDLEEVRDLVDFLPDDLSFVKDIIDIIIERQKIVEQEISDNNADENNPVNDDTFSPQQPTENTEDDTKEDEDTEDTTENDVPSDTGINTSDSDTDEDNIAGDTVPETSYTEGSMSETIESDDTLPDMFTEPTDIVVNFIEPKTLVQIAQEDYQRDTLDLNEYYLQTLQTVLQQYFQQMMTIMQECGISDISNLIRDFDGDSVSVSKSDLVHLKDHIIRSQITRKQKTRMFKKTHNVDNTMIHMRSWHVAEQERERYYTEKYEDSDTFLNSSSNAILRESRASYDKNYSQNLYNMYKYLNSSALLIGDILTMTVKEAQAKGKLLKEGVDIFVSKETINQQTLTQQIASYEAQLNSQVTSSTDTTTTTQQKTEDVVSQSTDKKQSSSNAVENAINSQKDSNNNIFTVAGGILG